MTTFRFSILAVALVAGAPAARSNTAADANLRLAAKAALGRLEIRQKDVPGPGETTVVKAVRLLELPFGPVLITEVNIENGSHAEVGTLGIYYLKRVGTRYTLRKKWPNAVEGGGFGSAPEWSVNRHFTKYPAIYATSGWTGQGCTGGWSMIAELAPSRPLVSDAIHTSMSDAGVGSGKADEYAGRIRNIRKGSSFEVSATGTDHFVEHYLSRKGRFVLVERESRLEC
jgi:hypothetical protein